MRHGWAIFGAQTPVCLRLQVSVNAFVVAIGCAGAPVVPGQPCQRYCIFGLYQLPPTSHAEYKCLALDIAYMTR